MDFHAAVWKKIHNLGIVPVEILDPNLTTTVQNPAFPDMLHNVVRSHETVVRYVANEDTFFTPEQCDNYDEECKISKCDKTSFSDEAEALRALQLADRDPFFQYVRSSHSWIFYSQNRLRARDRSRTSQEAIEAVLRQVDERQCRGLCSEVVPNRKITIDSAAAQPSFKPSSLPHGVPRTRDELAAYFKTLRVSGMYISQQNAQSFANLESVDVSQNSITSLHGLPPKILHLCVANNPIANLQGHSSSLQSLDLSGCPVQSLVGIQNFPSLQALSLRNTDLCDINSILTYLPGLAQLSHWDARGTPLSLQPYYVILVMLCLPHVRAFDGVAVPIVVRRWMHSLRVLLLKHCRCKSSPFKEPSVPLSSSESLRSTNTTPVVPAASRRELSPGKKSGKKLPKPERTTASSSHSLSLRATGHWLQFAPGVLSASALATALPPMPSALAALHSKHADDSGILLPFFGSLLARTYLSSLLHSVYGQFRGVHTPPARITASQAKVCVDSVNPMSNQLNLGIQVSAPLAPSLTVHNDLTFFSSVLNLARYSTCIALASPLGINHTPPPLPPTQTPTDPVATVIPIAQPKKQLPGLELTPQLLSKIDGSLPKSPLPGKAPLTLLPPLLVPKKSSDKINSARSPLTSPRSGRSKAIRRGSVILRASKGDVFSNLLFQPTSISLDDAGVKRPSSWFCPNVITDMLKTSNEHLELNSIFSQLKTTIKTPSVDGLSVFPTTADPADGTIPTDQYVTYSTLTKTGAKPLDQVQSTNVTGHAITAEHPETHVFPQIISASSTESGKPKKNNSNVHSNNTCPCGKSACPGTVALILSPAAKDQKAVALQPSAAHTYVALHAMPGLPLQSAPASVSAGHQEHPCVLQWNNGALGKHSSAVQTVSDQHHTNSFVLRASLSCPVAQRSEVLRACDPSLQLGSTMLVPTEDSSSNTTKSEDTSIIKTDIIASVKTTTSLVLSFPLFGTVHVTACPTPQTAKGIFFEASTISSNTKAFPRAEHQSKHSNYNTNTPKTASNSTPLQSTVTCFDSAPGQNIQLEVYQGTPLLFSDCAASWKTEEIQDKLFPETGDSDENTLAVACRQLHATRCGVSIYYNITDQNPVNTSFSLYLTPQYSLRQVLSMAGVAVDWMCNRRTNCAIAITTYVSQSVLLTHGICPQSTEESSTAAAVVASNVSAPSTGNKKRNKNNAQDLYVLRNETLTFDYTRVYRANETQNVQLFSSEDLRDYKSNDLGHISEPNTISSSSSNIGDLSSPLNSLNFTKSLFQSNASLTKKPTGDCVGLPHPDKPHHDIQEHSSLYHPFDAKTCPTSVLLWLLGNVHRGFKTFQITENGIEYTLTKEQPPTTPGSISGSTWTNGALPPTESTVVIVENNESQIHHIE